eukprot:TRINITY_DN1392_c0_g2_i5.p1 TRINITY_DN1392_c0_g2~~TRINITY_DN1392_c0_g2_i5.p1  ORF type:complete len:389 (-),score=67.43 TRINITY_DN1392_c0_g2_i5:46-1212(-)
MVRSSFLCVASFLVVTIGMCHAFMSSIDPTASALHSASSDVSKSQSSETMNVNVGSTSASVTTNTATSSLSSSSSSAPQTNSSSYTWSCTYTTPMGTLYDFTTAPVVTSMDYTHYGSLYYVALCNSYRAGVSVWLHTPTQTLDLGYFVNAQISELSSGEGLRFVFTGQPANSTTSGGGQQMDIYTTIVQVNCYEDRYEDQTVISDVSLVGVTYHISMSSSYACPVYGSSDSDDQIFSLDPFVIIFGLFIILLLLLCTAVCCCMLRRSPANVGTPYTYIQSDDRDNDRHEHEVLIPSPPPPPSPPVSPKVPSDSTTVTINGEDADDDDDGDTGDQSNSSNLCKICFDNKIDCVILNCGHAVSCLQCTQKVTLCPTCRKSIERLVKIYHM